MSLLLNPSSPAKFAGFIEAHAILTNGSSLFAERWWILRANISLPAPLSPTSKTGILVGAISATTFSSVCITVHMPPTKPHSSLTEAIPTPLLVIDVVIILCNGLPHVYGTTVRQVLTATPLPVTLTVMVAGHSL